MWEVPKVGWVIMRTLIAFCFLRLQILVLKTDTQDLVASFRVTTGTSNTTAIKSIEFARKGRWVIYQVVSLKMRWKLLIIQGLKNCHNYFMQHILTLYFLFFFNAMHVLCNLSYSCFLINTADRIIRVYDGREILTCGRDGEPEPMQKLQDLVNR